ncbi:NUDIX domain-containing protein [Nonomuraea rubra]|uniref:NUDIX domain-containing protein n=1 Tax=Nonomuraea rubra TaxID=46180 RepID=UPI003406A072
MGLDLSLVPDIVKPMALPLTGGALPEADAGGITAEARTLEELADTLAEIKADDAGAVMRLLRDGLWEGAAKESFEQVFTALSGREDTEGSPEALLDLLEQALRDEARSLREHGVRMQHTEWMIYASLALLGAMIVRLLVWIHVNGPAVLRLIQHNTLLTKVNIQTLKRLILLNMLRFGGIMGGLDLGVQVAQQLWGEREGGDFDLESLALSLGSGALTGALFAGANAGLSRLLSRRMVYVASRAEPAVRDRLVALGQSMYGQALLGGVTGTAGAVPGLALSGQLDAEHLGYTFISGVAGGLDVPAAARVSYLPMLATAELGPNPAGGPPGSRTDATTLVQHGPPESRSDPGTVADRPPPHPEPSGGTLAPHRGDTIVGEVVQRRDTLLPPERATPGGAVPAGRPGPGGAVPPERHGPGGAAPAERSPMGGMPAVRSDAETPGGLPRGSALPATLPAVNAVPHVTEPAEQHPAEQHPAGKDSAGRNTAERDTGRDAADAEVSRPAPLPQRDHGTTPVADEQTSTASRPVTDRTELPAVTGTAPAAARPAHGDRPAEAPQPAAPPRDEAAPPVHGQPRTPGEHPPAQDAHQRTKTADPPTETAHPPAETAAKAPAEPAHPPASERPDGSEALSTPAVRSRALPAGPASPGPQDRVASLLSQDGAYDPISLPAWAASDRAAVQRLMDTMGSPTKDLLGATRKDGLLRAIGDPGHLLVHSEYQALGRTLRSWQAVERSDLPSFVRAGDIVGPRRILHQLAFDSPEAAVIARRLAVEQLIRMWGFGAGELLPPRLAMNMAALDEFGLTGVLDLQAYADHSRARTAARDYARDGEVLRDFLRQQYAQTQHELSRHGIEELTLYRGVAFEWGHPMPALAAAATGDVVAAPPALPLQSWSAIPGVAKRYTGLGDGAVMAGVFPASRVLATPWTGMGQLPLHEFVLLAGPGEVTVLRPPHVAEAGPGPAYADLPRGWRIRQSGDAWTECGQGHRHWGPEGAAGLLPFHRGPGGEVHVLLQLRSVETHHGGLWAPVAGARQAGEPPVETAFREAGEEMRLDLSEVEVRAVHHDDHGGWAFDTVIGEVPSRVDVWPASPESIDLAWVPLREVASLDLHPDFAAAWPEVRARLEHVLEEPGTAPHAPETAAPETAVPETAVAGAGEVRNVRMPAVPGPPDTALADGYSPIADPRPRNFAEAAATFYRWTPGDGDRHEDGAPNRIERLLNGDDHGQDGGPSHRELLERGNRLMRELPVERQSDAAAQALASMSTSLRAENPRRAIGDLAMQLFGARLDVDALIELHQDAQRQGLAPEAARDRAELAGILGRAMAADRHRWLGVQHRSLLPSSTVAETRVAGLLVEMMGPLVTRSTVSTFMRPLLEAAGVHTVRQVVPLVQAAHANGHLPPGTSGDRAFHEAMLGFRQVDPELWNGLLVAGKYALGEVSDDGVRVLSALNDVVTHPETGMGRRVVLPLERLAHEVGQAGSLDQLIRLAGDARAHGDDPARAASARELTELLVAHRGRDPYLWDGLRLADEYGVPRATDDEVRALARLTEITAPGPSSRMWVFDPLRRLADEAGLGPSAERLVQRAAEAAQRGFDLFGPVDRRQVLDALRTPRPEGGAPDQPTAPAKASAPGLHDLPPAAVRDAREAASRDHARAWHEYRHSLSRLRRSLQSITGAGPRTVLEQRMVASLESRVQAWRRWPDVSEVSYTRDFDTFRTAYDQAVERGLRGEAVIPYLYENATASLGAREGGRGFGLEIEFDLPDGAMTDRAMGIPRALHEAGLTADATVHAYHTSKDGGYRSGAHGGLGLWRMESDSTVMGELVSPILYDEPETWENLRLACEIIRAHGGVASVRTGGHIHVSTHDYDHLVANYTSVLNYVAQHTDTLYRLGHNPEREGHRGQDWCRPSEPLAEGYRSVADVRGLHGRKTAVNTFGVTGGPADHVEFRMWDGSLDPAVIQSQVKVSLALVEAAFRTTILDAQPNGGRHEPLGAHEGLRRLGSIPDTTEEGSLSFRLLMDELFWRAADKEQLTALYAVTRWAVPHDGEP